MSFFSIALVSRRLELKLTQGQVAEKADINQTQISRYEAADARPDTANLARLCAVLDDSSHPLLIAFLRDEIPPELREKIQIQPASMRRTEDPPRPPAYNRLPKTVRDLIDEIARECERDPGVFSAIDSTMSLVRRTRE